MEQHGQSLDPNTAALRALARQFPTLVAVHAEIARLNAELTLPKQTVHVISDVHGEYAKLRHVINNASGTLRPLVTQLFAGKLSPAELQEFLTLIFYPKETLERIDATMHLGADRYQFFRRTLENLFIIIRALARRKSLRHALTLFPAEYRDLLQELLLEDPAAVHTTYADAIIDTLAARQLSFQLIRLCVRLVRNLAIDELIIAGDCWDRGPRGDRVVDYLRKLPNVSIVWGNHDAAWLGACLGQEALITSVLRISIRYRRLSQLEEGYGITMQPLEQLARTVYGDDPAECFLPRGTGLRETILMARMQKAAAILQFKLEGQTIARNPEFDLDHRRLLHRIDYAAGTIEIDSTRYQLRDSRFPTIDPARPYDLSPEEQTCLNRIKQSFLASQNLWEHMQFLVGRGSMWLNRDEHLIFHGCIPVDDSGEFLPFPMDGVPRRGKEMFEAIEQVVFRVMDRPTEKDRDLLWYLWCGPRSPLFGKDRIATLENDLIENPATHAEKKNPYFHLIHDAPFCERVLAEFGADPQRGLIVNGHVPVKIEKGESPLKRSGKAITIDGAFSEAYGDRGYTLVLEPERTSLAEHHHFDSVAAAVRDGVDIIPKVSVVREWTPPRRVEDTEQGDEIRSEIALLEQLAAAYQANKLRQA